MQQEHIKCPDTFYRTLQYHQLVHYFGQNRNWGEVKLSLSQHIHCYMSSITHLTVTNHYPHKGKMQDNGTYIRTKTFKVK